MPIVIITTQDRLLDLVLKAGDAGTGDGPTPTLHQDDDAFGGRPDQERALEDSALAALGLERFVLPSTADPVATLARAAVVAAHNWGYNADRGDSEQEAAQAAVAEGALMVGLGMLRAAQLPAPQAGPGRFYSITTSHADPADGANLLSKDHRLVLVEPLGEAGYRYLVEKPGTAPAPTAIKRFDQAAAAHRATAELLKDAGDHFLRALRFWEQASGEPGAADLMAEEGWTVENTHTAGWTVKRRPGAYLWETDASALGFVRERAASGALHQAAVNLVDAQVLVARALRIGGVP